MSVYLSLYIMRSSSTCRKYPLCLSFVECHKFWSFPGVGGKTLTVWRTLVPPWSNHRVVRMFGP